MARLRRTDAAEPFPVVAVGPIVTIPVLYQHGTRSIGAAIINEADLVRAGTDAAEQRVLHRRQCQLDVVIADQDRETMAARDVPSKRIEDRSEWTAQGHFQLRASLAGIDGPTLEALDREEVDEITGDDQLESLVRGQASRQTVDKRRQSLGLRHHVGRDATEV